VVLMVDIIVVNGCNGGYNWYWKVVVDIWIGEIQGIPWGNSYCCVFFNVWIQAGRYLDTLITIHGERSKRS